MLNLKGLFKKSSAKLIAINQKPVKSAWGGGNQFIQLLERYLKEQGCRVTYKLKNDVKAILLVAPKPFQNVTFGVGEIAEFKKKYPHVKCVHRINQTNKGRNSTTVDDLLMDANSVADHTVFISKWVRDYEADRWYDENHSHEVIYNGADDKIFFPGKHPVLIEDKKIKVITHHWSDNWNKGFRIYQEVDSLIASGLLPGFSLSVVGRWPEEIKWKTAHTTPPQTGQRLADTLREHDLYLTGAIWEAGGMHHIEGAQCGLPVVYHKDGGGITELTSHYGVEFSDNVIEALIQAKRKLSSLNNQVLDFSPSGTKMCKQYMEALLS